MKNYAKEDSLDYCKSVPSSHHSSLSHQGHDNVPALTADARWWFVQMHTDAPSCHKIKNFKVWINQNPTNRRAYQELEQLWTVFGRFAAEPALEAMRRDARKQHLIRT